jgi:glycosyltransferase involved in cell wall biosynthesis
MDRRIPQLPQQGSQLHPFMTRPLHVAILADIPRHSTRGNSQGRGGGHGATWLPPLADAFLEHPELKITWVTLDHLVRKPETDQDGNQTFLRLPKPHDKLNLILGQRMSRRILRKTIAQLQPDLIHAWGTEWMYASVMQDVSLPRILSVQGCLTTFNRVWETSWVHRQLEKQEPKRVAEADIITCESPWSAEQIQALAPSADIRIVDYGVHPSFFDVPWQPDEHHPKLAYSGSIDRRKGMDVLFDALALLPDRRWTLQIFGHGPMEEELRARNLPNVEWMGTLRWQEMQQHLSKAWGLVIPTRADTGPTVVKEARVIGLPIIGTRHGGLRDYIRHGENGWIVDPLDAPTLAETCARLMSDFQNVLAMGKSGHPMDRDSFMAEVTAQKFGYIYRELAR